MGYSGNGFVCADVDECTDPTLPPPCSPDATCTNTPGSYTCTCNPGFTGDGVTCTDIDECAMGLDTCDPVHATCTNTPGSYTCACNVPYSGDGMTCTTVLGAGPGKVVLVGHDMFMRTLPTDVLMGNIIALANTGAPVINVLGYTQFADVSATGEVANTKAAINSRLGALARSAMFTDLNDYTALAANLPGQHVLLVYEQEIGVDGVMVGDAWAPAVQAFLNAGGLVVVMDYSGTQGWQILNHTGAMHVQGYISSFSSGTLTVTVPGNPIAAAMGPTYPAANGTSTFMTNDGNAIVVDASGNPVVMQKRWGRRFDGTWGASFQTRAPAVEFSMSLQSFAPLQFQLIYNMYDATGEKYDPMANTWTNLVATAPFNRGWFEMAPVGMNLWGIGGGHVYKYAAMTDTWTTAATITGADPQNMTEADEYGKIYGYDTADEIVVYNPFDSTVTYHATGVTASDETRLAYDPATRTMYFGSWTTPMLYKYELDTGTVSMTSPNPEGALSDMVCSDRSGHIYVGGGTGGGTNFYMYDIDTDTWAVLPPLPGDQGVNGTCTVSNTGWLYVSTGTNLQNFRIALN
jgi:hypothetical protein